MIYSLLITYLLFDGDLSTENTYTQNSFQPFSPKLIMSSLKQLDGHAKFKNCRCEIKAIQIKISES